LVSADGPIWSRVPPDETVLGGPGEQLMDTVIAAGSGLVAVGYIELDGDYYAAVWTSSDGSNWSRVLAGEAIFGGPGEHAMTSVAAAGSRLVAVGYVSLDDEFDAAVWTSPDGFNWSRVPHDEAAFGGDGNQIMHCVIAVDSGFVAVGHDGSGGDLDAAAWTSPDGLNWSQVPHDEAIFGGADTQLMRSADAMDLGIVAVAYDKLGGDRDAAVWTSPDGFNWSRVPHDEAVFGGDHSQEMNAVAAMGSSLVAVGYQMAGGEQDAVVWVSPDGLNWTRVSHDEAIFGGEGDQEMRSVVAVDSRLFAVGHTGPPGDWDAAVWYWTPD
jgi:hypothetical protein